MPLFIDIHEIQGGVTASAVAEAHAADMAIQAKYDVNYVKYWVNEAKGKIFCLCSAPTAEAADRVHRESHGLAAERIVEVDPDMAEGFLGGGPIAATGAAVLPNTSQCDPGLRTIVFTDIVDSTLITQRVGDKAAMVIVDHHDNLVRSALARTGGREVKHLGDGIMAVFASAVQAMQCASLVQSGLADHARQSPEHNDRFRIRIGSAAGEPLERKGDFFGSTVQLASRLCAHATPNQTLVSTSVAELCAGTGFRFDDLGHVTLKGFDEPVRAYAAMSAEFGA